RVEFPKIGKRSAVSFGGGEVFSVPRHVKTRGVSTFMSVGTTAPWMLNLGFTLLGAVLKTPLSNLVYSRIDNQAFGPDEEERKRSLFTILCQARSAQRMEQVTITGRDPYGLTAIICAETAAQLTTTTRSIGGVTSPAGAFGPEVMQRATEAAGVEW